MNKKSQIAFGFLAALLVTGGASVAAELSPIEKLGKSLFFEKGLSNPPGQSCASCHDPSTGWTGPDSATNLSTAVYEGAVHTRYGNRKPPAAAYAGFNPLLHQCGDMMSGGMGNGGMGNGGMGNGGMGNMTCNSGDFVGGMFWDGRASGWVLGDPLAEQAMAPYLNPLEQNNPNAMHLCLQVRKAGLETAFEEVWGEKSLDCVKDVDETYKRIGRTVAAYERSEEVNPFSSKFDLFWKNSVGKMPPVPAINAMNLSRFQDRGLDDTELKGLMVFNTKGKCSICHTLMPMAGSSSPLLTDFRYHNLGMPKNSDNPFYSMPKKWNPLGQDWVDQGLGGFLAKTAGMTDLYGNPRDYVQDAILNYGKHKTPSLRNVDKRPAADFIKAYGHNGYFKSLQEIVHFYNLRDVLPVCNSTESPPDAMGAATCFPAPEVGTDIDRQNMGNLGLTPAEGMALMKFLQTLSDGYPQQ